MVDDSKHTCVMCVGHNKGWQEAASSLGGKSVALKSASAALLQCVAASWKDVLVNDAQWTLVDVVGASSV